DNYEEIQSGYHEISSSASFSHERLFLDDLTFDQACYLYIYTSMQSDVTSPVYFDDFKVTHTHSPIVSKDDYYPFGLTFSGYNRPASTAQNFKYNGKEEISDLGVNWHDYGARMYQSDLGRWFSIDPMSELTVDKTPYHYVANNPVSHIDPNGMYSLSINGKKVKGKKKKDVIAALGLPSKKKKSSDKKTEDSDPSELVEDSDSYSHGALIQNEYVAYRKKEGTGLVDMSGNPSLSVHNRTGHIYNGTDLRIRRALYSKFPNNPITVQLMILEQQGNYVPLSADGYLNDFYSKYGDGADPNFNLGAQYMQMMFDVSSGVGGANGKVSARGFRRSANRVGRRLKRSTDGPGSSSRHIRNRWNRFLRNNKGKFKGSNWMKQARRSYYNWRLNGGK
ncbi:MAG: RHS repeat-associated core domain-containing protein, partial [Reichenbachiella sp.]|uniref:RHS repeat-associated core domain-containing protein n=1 Tax=Reichenbachiella sp. TaxID=2184521 RepID=UPI00326434BA